MHGGLNSLSACLEEDGLLFDRELSDWDELVCLVLIHQGVVKAHDTGGKYGGNWVIEERVKV